MDKGVPAQRQLLLWPGGFWGQGADEDRHHNSSSGTNNEGQQDPTSRNRQDRQRSEDSKGVVNISHPIRGWHRLASILRWGKKVNQRHVTEETLRTRKKGGWQTPSCT